MSSPHFRYQFDLEFLALVVELNTDGETVVGSKDDLIASIRSGNQIRIYWAAGRVEHLSDAGFLTIFGDEVFAQVPPIRAQKPSRTTTPPEISLAEEGSNWQGFFSTRDTGMNTKWFRNR